VCVCAPIVCAVCVCVCMCKCAQMCADGTGNEQVGRRTSEMLREELRRMYGLPEEQYKLYEDP